MTEDHIPEAPIAETLDQQLGFEFVSATAEEATARMPVTDRVRQPFGIVHGGAYAALAESLVSMATYRAVSADGMVAMGSSNHTSFLRPVSSGSVTARARRRHRGRTTWVWEVDFTDEGDRLCATTRVTLAIRPRPDA